MEIKYVFSLDLLKWFEVKETSGFFGYKLKPDWEETEYSESWYLYEDEVLTLPQVVDILLELKDEDSIQEFKRVIFMYGNTLDDYDEWVSYNEN